MLIFFVFLFFLTIYFSAHWLLYLSAVSFYSADSATVRLVLGGVLFWLAISFFISSWLSHLNENFLTRPYYLLSAFWLGLLTNLLISALASWLAIRLFRYAGIGLPKAHIATFFFIAALLVSIYGVWNALNPRLKHLEVVLPGLPPSWDGQKIIHLSDVHLGHIHKEAFMRRIVGQINSVRPAMVLITGDLFDGMDGNLREGAKPLNEISAPRGIYFVNGNHETYLGKDLAHAALKETPVKILQDEVADVDGLKLVGISYPDRTQKKDIPAVLRSLSDQFAGHPNILMYHAPFNIREISALGVNLELCGHTHKGQMFPFNFITRAVFRGYDYGLARIGNYTLYTSNGAGTWGPPMRIGNKPEVVAITLRAQ